MHLRVHVSEYVDDTVEPQVTKSGWAVQVMATNKDRPGYAYTIGLSAKRLPELLLALPIEPDLAIKILSAVANTFVQMGDATAGDLHRVVERLPIRVRFVDMTAFGEFGQIARFWADRHGHRLDRAMQVIMPDAEGNFPGDPLYDWIPQVELPRASDF